MGMSPIDYDVTLMFIMIYWVEYHIAYEHDDLFDILSISQLHMICGCVYVCVCVCLLVLGVHPEAHN